MAESTSLKSTPSSDVLALLATQEKLPLPFARDIPLLCCAVAGTSHRSLEAAEPGIAIGQELRLLREPRNPHDDLAIRIEAAKGTHLGYLPRRDNPVIARLMDAGKHLVARVTAKEWRASWLCIEVEVLLREQ